MKKVKVVLVLLFLCCRCGTSVEVGNIRYLSLNEVGERNPNNQKQKVFIDEFCAKSSRDKPINQLLEKIHKAHPQLEIIENYRLEMRRDRHETCWKIYSN